MFFPFSLFAFVKNTPLLKVHWAVHINIPLTIFPCVCPGRSLKSFRCDLECHDANGGGGGGGG